MTKYKIFKIESQNKDKVYIGCTSKKYFFDIFDYYSTLYRQYKDLSLEDYLKKYKSKRKFFPIFEAGYPRWQILREVEATKDEIKQIVREIKREYPNDYLGLL
jgi:hypothetical protein